MDYLNEPVDILNVSVRTVNALKSDDIFYIRDLIKLRKIDVLKIGNLGKKSLDDIRLKLYDLGLSLSEDKFTKKEKNLSNDLRDHFAGLAMAAYLNNDKEYIWEEIAEWSYQMADAMLDHRESINAQPTN